MSDVGFYRENGYQVVRGLLDPAVVRDIGAFLRTEMKGAERSALDPREASMLATGHFPLQTRLSPRLWEIPRQPSLQTMLRDVLDSDGLFMHMPPTARLIKPGNERAAVPAHQDVSYNRHMSDFVTVWVPCVDIDEAMGGVAVFEGSQNLPEQLDTLEGGDWLKPVSSEGYRRVECRPMRVGDVLLLNRWIVHESIPNRSDSTRISIDMRFFGGNAISTKHHLDMRSWTVRAPVQASGGNT